MNCENTTEEREPTREDLIARIRQVFNPKLAGEVAIVMGRFPTIAAFIAADAGALQKANRLARPDAKRDLGARFFAAHDDLAAFVKERRWLAAKDREERRRAQEERREREARENPLFSLAQMRSLVSFMELCGIAAMDLKGATEFFRVMKVELASPPPLKASRRGWRQGMMEVTGFRAARLAA